MQLKFIAILVAVLIISDALEAVKTKDNPGSSTIQNNLNKDRLRDLKNIHYYNTIFDDYSLGGPAYEPDKK